MRELVTLSQEGATTRVQYSGKYAKQLGPCAILPTDTKKLFLVGEARIEVANDLKVN